MDNSGSSENPGSTGNSGPADNSEYNEITDIDYYQREVISAKNAKKALEKDPSTWTQDEKIAAEAYKEIDEFNNDSLNEHIAFNTKNLRDAIKSSKTGVSNDGISTSKKRGADYTPQEGYVNKYIKEERSNDK